MLVHLTAMFVGRVGEFLHL